jgi:hypothetical protein
VSEKKSAKSFGLIAIATIGQKYEFLTNLFYWIFIAIFDKISFVF